MEYDWVEESQTKFNLESPTAAIISDISGLLKRNRFFQSTELVNPTLRCSDAQETTLVEGNIPGARCKENLPRQNNEQNGSYTGSLYNARSRYIG